MIALIIVIALIGFIFTYLSESESAVKWGLAFLVAVALCIIWCVIPYSECESVDIQSMTRVVCSTKYGKPKISYIYSIEDEDGYVNDITIDDTSKVRVGINEDLVKEYVVIQEKSVPWFYKLLFIGLDGPEYTFYVRKFPQ